MFCDTSPSGYRYVGFLFRYCPYPDPHEAKKSNLAVAYAYKELGALEKALEDCNASLRFGNLPDAYQKQQELIKVLKAR